MSAERTRNRILDAALKLFSQKGFLGATTRGIARDAGVAEVTLFRHFGSKEKLFEEVIRGYSFLPAMKGILPGLQEASYEEALLVIARRFLAMLDERRDLIRIMLAERHFYTPQVKNIFRGMLGEVFAMLADYFLRLQRQGMLRDFDPDDAAKAFLGAFFAYVHGLGFFFEDTADSKRRECFAVEFVRLFVEGTIRQRPDDARRKKPAWRGSEVKAGSQPWTARTR
jgi:AcrR family transcriptional regulator